MPTLKTISDFVSLMLIAEGPTVTLHFKVSEGEPPITTVAVTTHSPFEIPVM